MANCAGSCPMEHAHAHKEKYGIWVCKKCGTLIKHDYNKFGSAISRTLIDSDGIIKVDEV